MSKQKTEYKNKLQFEGFWDYDPAPETTSFVNIKEQYDLFIDGKWVKPEGEKYFSSINPANEQYRKFGVYFRRVRVKFRCQHVVANSFVMKGHGIQIVRIAHSGSPVTVQIMILELKLLH